MFIADVMTERETEIRIKGRTISVRLDYENWQWHYSVDLAEADFPIPAECSRETLSALFGRHVRGGLKVARFLKKESQTPD